MLQGAVVQVEPEPREPSLACALEQPLSLRASLSRKSRSAMGLDRARGLFEERLDISVAHAMTRAAHGLCHRRTAAPIIRPRRVVALRESLAR